jgi:hypothetical protein
MADRSNTLAERTKGFSRVRALPCESLPQHNHAAPIEKRIVVQICRPGPPRWRVRIAQAHLSTGARR